MKSKGLLISSLFTLGMYFCAVQVTSAQILESTDSLKKELKSSYFELGYALGDFHAKEYQESLSSGSVEYKYGASASLGYSFYPLRIHGSYTFGQSEIQNDAYLNDGTLDFHSIHGGLYLNVFPYTKWFLPEVGFGYNYVFLQNKGGDLANSYFSSDAISSFYWSGGIKVRILSNLYLAFTYNQGLPHYLDPINLSITEKLETDVNPSGTRFIMFSAHLKLPTS